MSSICRPIQLAVAVAALLLARGVPAQSAVPTTPELVRRLSALAESLAAHDSLSGVILLAKDGAPVFERAYGLADRGRRRPNTVGTAFNVSSIGKRFTQVAIAQLEASGRLHLDSTIASVWPDYPNREVASKVTIRELLDHRSGIGGNVFEQLSSLRHNSDYIPLFVHDTLHFAPGTKEEYSNAGYVVLGEIVARASGEEYYSYVQRHIFDPANMSATGFFARDSQPPFAAIGYTNRDGSVRPSTEMQPWRGSAAGGVYSSAHDLLRFIVAHRAGRLAAPVELRRAIIAGGSPGSNGVIAEGLPGGYDLIVLENLDPPAADAIVTPVSSWLGAPAPTRRIAAGGPPRALGGAATLPGTPAGQLVGDYLRAFNSGDPDVMGHFFDTRATSAPDRPTSARVATYRSVYADNGRLTLTALDAATSNAVTIRVSAEKGGAMTMTFDIDPSANRMTSLRLELSH